MMNVLGIETSCDETAVAVVVDGREVLSSVISSQIAQHAPYGGVVPEIASRAHVENLPMVMEQALTESGLGWDAIDRVAVTIGPGLASSLLIGVGAAKALALRLDLPLSAINHLEGHVYSIFVGADAPLPSEVCPYLCLLVSGGHTSLIRVNALGDYQMMGRTVDDAAGEAFDKGAMLLGLDYPGGPIVDRLARDGNVAFHRFPRSKPAAREGGQNNLPFSFSGLKTSLKYYLQAHPVGNDPQRLADVAASYQEAIVDALLGRMKEALGDVTSIACVGGVSLNSRLRERLKVFASEHGCKLYLADPACCMDNAAMIAGLAGVGRGVQGEEAMLMDVTPSMPVV